MKSLRSKGIDTAERAAARSQSDPWKLSVSVNTEIAEAPAASYERARSTGAIPSRIRPFEGDARLISAMTLTAAASESASQKRCGWADDLAAKACARTSSGGADCFASAMRLFLTLIIFLRTSTDVITQAQF